LQYYLIEVSLVYLLPRDATQSAVLLWQSYLSVRLSDCNVEVSWSHRLELFQNDFTIS